MRKLDHLARSITSRRSVARPLRAGETIAALAEAFGVTERHVRRLTEGIEPPPPSFTVDSDESVQVAVERFLKDVEQDPQGEVRAAAARALVRRLDKADTRAAPALARALIDLIEDLREGVGSDKVDELRRRRVARLLALQTAQTVTTRRRKGVCSRGFAGSGLTRMFDGANSANILP